MSYREIDKGGNIKWYNEDSPAIEYYSGYKEWYLDSKKYTEQEYKIKVRSKKLKEIL